MSLLLGVLLAAVTLALGVLLLVSVAPPDEFDVRRYVTANRTTTTVCCPAGTHGSSGAGVTP